MSASSASTHPYFSAPDADISLHCEDGTVFLVYSVVLRTTSGFFRALSSLPQPNTSSLSMVGKTERITLNLDEDPQTLESLLPMITGLEIPTFNSFESVEAVLFAAEKYDMPGPISIVRSFMLSPSFLADPLHVYLLACRYNWPDIASTAARFTLRLNIQDPDSNASVLLSRLGSSDMMRLFLLHWTRKLKFRDGLESGERFSKENGITVHGCGHANVDSTWPKLKLAMLREMERCPAGSAILDPGFTNWPSWQAVTAAQCSTCKQFVPPFPRGVVRPGVSPMYNANETLHAIRSLIHQLPTSIWPEGVCEFVFRTFKNSS